MKKFWMVLFFVGRIALFAFWVIQAEPYVMTMNEFRLLFAINCLPIAAAGSLWFVAPRTDYSICMAAFPISFLTSCIVLSVIAAGMKGCLCFPSSRLFALSGASFLIHGIFWGYYYFSTKKRDAEQRPAAS